MTTQGTLDESFRRNGMTVEFGSPGYPRELWIGLSNMDPEWNFWRYAELCCADNGHKHLVPRGECLWYGRWLRPPCDIGHF